MSINFYTTQEEAYLIERIADRACNVERGMEKLRLILDLSACHNSTPLNLQQMLYANEQDFMHDVRGITQHINRNTGVPETCSLLVILCDTFLKRESK